MLRLRPTSFNVFLANAVGLRRALLLDTDCSESYFERQSVGEPPFTSKNVIRARLPKTVNIIRWRRDLRAYYVV